MHHLDCPSQQCLRGKLEDTVSIDDLRGLQLSWSLTFVRTLTIRMGFQADGQLSRWDGLIPAVS